MRKIREPYVSYPIVEVVCKLCDRLIPEHAKQSKHHLTPVLKGGKNKETVSLHQICHDTIHAHYSESEIAKRLADIESLRADPIISAFIVWVKTKPDDFYTPTKLSNKKRRKR